MVTKEQSTQRLHPGWSLILLQASPLQMGTLLSLGSLVSTLSRLNSPLPPRGFKLPYLQASCSHPFFTPNAIFRPSHLSSPIFWRLGHIPLLFLQLFFTMQPAKCCPASSPPSCYALTKLLFFQHQLPIPPTSVLFVEPSSVNVLFYECHLVRDSSRIKTL